MNDKTTVMTLGSDVALPTPAQLRHFDIPGPRYTSYPTADRFVEAHYATAHARALAGRSAAAGPHSLLSLTTSRVARSSCATVFANRVIT